MALLNPDHLLEQADRLVAPPNRAPRQADLRRAISSAYYALFHAILAAAADEFVGRTKRQSPRYELVYRSVTHKSLRTLCEDIVKQKLPARYAKYEPAGGFDTDLIAVASATVDLQEKRHLADYDPLLRVTASDAVVAIATARSALMRFNTANVTRKKTFLSLIVFSPR
jgi:hypothetical protein